jgi:antitoxin ParD1/3/4
MTTISISIPEPLHDFVEKQVGEGRFPTASEYLGSLISEDQKRREQQHLEALLLEGLESGPMREMTQEAWQELKQRVWERDANPS